MDKALIYQKMRELEIKIHYHFNDIAWLAKAMRSEKIEGVGSKNHSEYTNEGLATVGDTLLKSVLADYLYRKERIAFRINKRDSYLSRRRKRVSLKVDKI